MFRIHNCDSRKLCEQPTIKRHPPNHENWIGKQREEGKEEEEQEKEEQEKDSESLYENLYESLYENLYESLYESLYDKLYKKKYGKKNYKKTNTLGQARKSKGRMPWRQKPKKDVASCEKLWEGANSRYTQRYPNEETHLW